MKKVVFTGCSFTSGHGWNVQRPGEGSCVEHPNLWVNLCHNQIPQLKNLELVNLGASSCNNTDIFQSTVKAISDYSDIDTIFCQWTAMPRYKFSVGFEFDKTQEAIQPLSRNKKGYDDNVRINHSREYIDDLLDKLRALHHLHREIIKVVEYCNILKNLSKKSNIKLYFVNGFCPWDQNYFIRLSGALPNDYTTFTKEKILQTNTRSQEDNIALYKIMHDEYDLAGGIDPADWVNLYSSMFTNIIDTNYDRLHPGIKTNQLYFQQVKHLLDTQ
jgi:hypothetical protein